jgi:hypothetical protein
MRREICEVSTGSDIEARVTVAWNVIEIEHPDQHLDGAPVLPSHFFLECDAQLYIKVENERLVLSEGKAKWSLKKSGAWVLLSATEPPKGMTEWGQIPDYITARGKELAPGAA